MAADIAAKLARAAEDDEGPPGDASSPAKPPRDKRTAETVLALASASDDYAVRLFADWAEDTGRSRRMCDYAVECFRHPEKIAALPAAQRQAFMQQWVRPFFRALDESNRNHVATWVREVSNACENP
jgi:hypothetical protein